MGRLFQYNRFGATESVNKHKKDTQKKSQDKAKMLRNAAAINCAGYSDIYGTNAGKNLDLAFTKCQQWSNKLQPAAAPTPTPALGTAVDEPTTSRTHKVYDSMKNFLQRKLFAQSSRVQCEEPTSDYDEQDLLDSSYHADAETDEEEQLLGNCSCSSSSTPKRVNKSPQKSLLSLNCWQSSQPSDTSGGEDVDADGAQPAEQDESDAGISDCCQLLNESTNNSNGNAVRRRSTPRKRAPSRCKQSYPTDDDDDDADEEPELLECAWYQPRITAKAAQEHLQAATAGSFLLRRRTPRSYELCLRLDHKVKCYAVQCSRNEMYSLKGARKQFTTLKALITHHSVMAEQLPITLDMPRERDLVKSSAVRYADDFEPLESLQLLGILKSLQAKSYEA